MPRADFAIVPFHHNFTENDRTITKNFDIEGVPLDHPVDEENAAYLMIQTKGVTADDTDVRINNLSLGGTFDIPFLPGNENEWVLTLRHLKPGILTTGDNHISITSSVIGKDEFRIGNVIVNWREQ